MRKAFITGASRGIGRAIADCFTREGYEVITPSSRALDLSDPESISWFFSGFQEPIDVLVNNAGTNQLAGLDDITVGHLNSTLAINLQGPILVAKALVPGMKSRQYGRILNISSIWSVVAKQRRLPYIAAKSGINGITRALALELAPFNVLVNALAPGYVNTDLTRQNNSEEALQGIRAMIPVGRLAEPEEIAEFAVFLCSERNSYLTGQTVVMDGGYTIL